MKNLILPIIASLAFAVTAPAADKSPTVDEPPKITHENLYQMEELVKQGADPNAPYWLYPGLPCTVDVYPLYAAIQSRDAKLVKRLLALGAKPRAGQLQQAAWRRELRMVKMLVEAGLDPNGTKNSPPLTSAAYHGYVAMVEYLLAQPGIKVDAKDIDGYSALMHAADNGHTKVVELLLKAGANPDMKNKYGDRTASSLVQGEIAKRQKILSMLKAATDNR